MSAVISDLPKPYVELIGQDGNAFSILGLCTRELRKVGWNQEQVKAFQDEATEGDYNHLLCTATKYLDVN